MIEIEVTVTCDSCGLSEWQSCDDGWEVNRFIDDLDDWDDEYTQCPNCRYPELTCTQCDDTTTSGIEDVGWTQFTDASMTGVITLCYNCSAQHAALRIP